MREEYRNKTPDNGDFWREKLSLEQSGDSMDGSGSADEDSGSELDEDKGRVHRTVNKRANKQFGGPWTKVHLRMNYSLIMLLFVLLIWLGYKISRIGQSSLAKIYFIFFLSNKRHETAYNKSKIVETRNYFYFHKR